MPEPAQNSVQAETLGRVCILEYILVMAVTNSTVRAKLEPRQGDQTLGRVLLPWVDQTVRYQQLEGLDWVKVQSLELMWVEGLWTDLLLVMT